MPYTPDFHRVPAQRRPARRQRVAQTAREEAAYDPGPWENFASSSRVSRARYDPKNQLLELDWIDGGLSYMYSGVPSNVWRNLLRAKSKGRFVNRVLNAYPYAPKVD